MKVTNGLSLATIAVLIAMLTTVGSGGTVSAAPIPGSLCDHASSIRPSDGIGELRLGMTVGEMQHAISTQAIPLLGTDSNFHLYNWQQASNRGISVYTDHDKAVYIGLSATVAPAASGAWKCVTEHGITLRSLSADVQTEYGLPSLIGREDRFAWWVYDSVGIVFRYHLRSPTDLFTELPPPWRIADIGVFRIGQYCRTADLLDAAFTALERLTTYKILPSCDQLTRPPQ